MTQKSHNKSQTDQNREMKGRKPENRTDLLVCFPSRTHNLTLMPKSNFSPARQFSDPPNNNNNRRHRRSRSRAGASSSQARPIEIGEPTSPKVTCAGQIKVITPKPKTCKNWQSVMEEIERLHNNRKQRKKSTWAESIGFKKDAYQFLTCLRHLRFDFRCFGAFGSSDPHTTTDEDDEDDYQETQMVIDHDDKESSRTVFSKWFMVLQEEQNKIVQIKEENGNGPCAAPPPNALLLMRCRSAPVKNWEVEKKEKLNSLKVLMKCDAEFDKLSSDIVGGAKDQLLLRSRTWKR